MSFPYTAIYADPPWPYDNPRDHRPDLGGYTYSPMTLESIQALPIEKIAAKDALLFLWVPMPKLPEGIATMRAWGFRFTTCAFCWVKLNPSGEGIYSGLGSWTNQNAELCLLGKRGTPKRVAKNVKQIIQAARGRHSAKPGEVRERIVTLLGDVPRIELFARERVEGWDSLGWELSGRDIREELEELIHAARRPTARHPLLPGLQAAPAHDAELHPASPGVARSSLCRAL